VVLGVGEVTVFLVLFGLVAALFMVVYVFAVWVWSEADDDDQDWWT
jgi:hypothetical protein